MRASACDARVALLGSSLEAPTSIPGLSLRIEGDSPAALRQAQAQHFNVAFAAGQLVAALPC
jgi:hypothetical protein